MGKRWAPLESNPDVLNAFAKQIGAPTDKYAFCDVYGMDEELLAMVPQPVKAVLMLFPITEATEAAKDEEDARLRSAEVATPAPVWFTKQTISNACGTVAVLHAFANNPEMAPVPESFLARYLDRAASMTPDERARFLEYPGEGEPDIEDAHQSAASTGQTAPPSEDEQVLLHFVCFVEREGRLYELDGRKFSAVDHGPSTPTTLLKDACAVVSKYVHATNSIQFNLIALCACD